MGKYLAGMNEDLIILEDGHWWKLAAPVTGDRLDYIGKPIKSLRVIDGKLEVIINKECRFFLHWRNEEGEIIGPQIPQPGKIRCWDSSMEDDFWAYLDAHLDKMEAAYEDINGYNKSEDKSEQHRRDGTPTGEDGSPSTAV